MDYTTQKIDDKGNSITCNFDWSNLPGFKLLINGSNNTIFIKSKPLLQGNLVININANDCNINLGNNITCKKNVFISLLPSGGGRASSHLTCSIGDNTIFNDSISIVLAENNNEVIIGKNCLFASNISISTTDSHQIFSTETNERLNKAKSIYVGNHVWICENVKILKGSVILDNSICATSSLINRVFDSGNVILAGIPAKIVNRNVNWDF